MAEAKVEDKKVKELAVSDRNFHEAQFRQNMWFAIAEVGTKPDDTLAIDYWKHVSGRKLRPGDKISIMCEDKSWYGEAVVFATYGHGAVTRFIFPPTIIREKAEIPAGDTEYVVEDGGLAKKWCVRRVKDNRFVMTGLESKEAANAWIFDFVRSQGQRAA